MNKNKNSLLGMDGLLVFQINDKEYCSDIDNISVVLKLNEENMRNIEQMKGVMVFQDKGYRIIDVNEILKASKDQFTCDSKIILFEVFGSHFGFVVKKIVEIMTIDSIFVENSLEFFPYTDDNFIRGELLVHDRKILFLDFEKICRNLKVLSVLKVPISPEKVI